MSTEGPSIADAYHRRHATVRDEVCPFYGARRTANREADELLRSLLPGRDDVHPDFGGACYDSRKTINRAAGMPGLSKINDIVSMSSRCGPGM